MTVAPKKISDPRLGALAVAAGLIDESKVDECVALQKRMRETGEPAPLGAILVKKGYLSREQVGKILAWQKRLAAQSQDAAPQRKQIEGKKTLGPYPLLEEIGKGSMGAVYLSETPGTRIPVALKILPKKMAEDPEYLERFKREAKMTMALEHPNIVKGIDLDFDKGYHFMVLEYVDGPSLDKRLQKEKKLDYEEALFIARGIADALQHAKREGVIHRDIKPDNILIASDGTPKLTDLGLSLAKDSGDARLTMAGMAVGTPYYISPEQARGERNVDTRSDIYSLGATLYHLVTGQYPFNAKSSIHVMMAHVKEPLIPPRHIDPSLPPELDALICKMMEKAPEDRFQTPKKLVEAIDCVIRGEFPADTKPSKSKSSGRGKRAPRPRRQKSRGKPVSPFISIAIGVVIIVVLSVVVYYIKSGGQ